MLLFAVPVAAGLALWRGNFRVEPRAGARALRPRLRDRLPGRLCDRDQGGAVRRHAPFHLRAAADRRCGGSCRRSGSRLVVAVPLPTAGLGVLALYGFAHISIMAMLHPDQYVYYNAFVGGVEGAQHKFKLDYWANSYAEAVQGLEDYLRAEYGADFEEREFTVAVCGPPISADYYFPPNFRFVRDRARADFFIAFTKDNCERSLARPADLSGRADGCAPVSGARSARSPCRAAGREAGLCSVPFEAVPRIAAAVEFAPIAVE